MINEEKGVLKEVWISIILVLLVLTFVILLFLYVKYVGVDNSFKNKTNCTCVNDSTDSGFVGIPKCLKYECENG